MPPAPSSPNPFATRFVAPGRLAWIGHGEQSIPALRARFRKLGRRAQIVGPHGSGKSTLLAHLVPLLGDGDQDLPRGEVVWLQLRRRDPVRQLKLRSLWKLREADILVLDGFEQLSPVARRLVIGWTRWRRCGLLVTSHHQVQLPVLTFTEVSAHLAHSVIQAVCGQTGKNDEIAACLQVIDLGKLLREHQGNLRECLMELYDVVESSRCCRSGQES